METIKTNYFKPKRKEKKYSNKEKLELIELAKKLINLSAAAKRLYVNLRTA